MTLLCSILRDKYINRVLDLVKLRLLRSEFFCSKPPHPPPPDQGLHADPAHFISDPPLLRL